jgi:hypothetical protein
MCCHAIFLAKWRTKGTDDVQRYLCESAWWGGEPERALRGRIQRSAKHQQGWMHCACVFSPRTDVVHNSSHASTQPFPSGHSTSLVALPAS